MDISIRSATPEDARQIHAMILELARYEKQESAVRVTEEELRGQLSHARPPFACVIAEVDREIAGFALYFYAYSTWEGARTLYLEDLFVRAPFRKSGVGAAIMRFLSQVACDQDCRRFEWSVLDWNEPAISFYHRLGARPVAGWTRHRMDAETIEAVTAS